MDFIDKMEERREDANNYACFYSILWGWAVLASYFFPCLAIGAISAVVTGSFIASVLAALAWLPINYLFTVQHVATPIYRLFEKVKK